MKLLFSLFISISLQVSTCSDNNQIKEIKFGEGGGFTNAVITYEIKANGDVFLSNSLTKEYTKVKTLTTSNLKKIQTSVTKIPTESFTFNHPGNMYYFIEMETKKIVWGDTKVDTPTEAKKLFDQLKNMVEN